MTAQTANKATVPTGSDGWKITDHIKQAIETARTVVPVANKAERDGLAALFPGGVIPVGTTVCRLDRKSSLEPWNGSNWVPGPLGELASVTNAGNNTVGVALNNLLEATVYVEPNRIIEIKAAIDGKSSMDAMFVSYTLAYGGTGVGGTPLRTSTVRYTTTNLGEGFEFSARLVAGGGGPVRFNLQGQVTVPDTGGQTMTSTAGNTRLTVTDIGPA